MTVGYGRAQGRDSNWTRREEALLPSHAGATEPERRALTPALPLSGSIVIQGRPFTYHP